LPVSHSPKASGAASGGAATAAPAAAAAPPGLPPRAAPSAAAAAPPPGPPGLPPRAAPSAAAAAPPPGAAQAEAPTPGAAHAAQAEAPPPGAAHVAEAEAQAEAPTPGAAHAAEAEAEAHAAQVNMLPLQFQGETQEHVVWRLREMKSQDQLAVVQREFAMANDWAMVLLLAKTYPNICAEEAGLLSMAAVMAWRRSPLEICFNVMFSAFVCYFSVPGQYLASVSPVLISSVSLGDSRVLTVSSPISHHTTFR
jgi:hypothetical protein